MYVSQVRRYLKRDTKKKNKKKYHSVAFDISEDNSLPAVKNTLFFFFIRYIIKAVF